MKNNAFIALLMVVFLTSCASYNPGKYADVMEGDHPNNLPINAEISGTLSTKPFTYVNFTFGSLNVNEWRRVKKIRVVNIGDIKDAKIVLGSDLHYWATGITRKVKIDQHNRAVTMSAISGALAIGGAVTAYNGNTKAGAGMMGAALVTAGAEDVNQVLDRAEALELAKLVPNDHLYTPFSIPPNLYITRWLLIQTPNGKQPWFIDFEVEYDGGQKAKYRVDLSSGRKKKY